MITLEEQVQYLQKRFKLMQEQIDAVSSIASQALDRATDALNATKRGLEPTEPKVEHLYGAGNRVRGYRVLEPPASEGGERD